MTQTHEEKRQAILQILRPRSEPLVSREIARRLEAAGYALGERTVRLYLGEMEAEGLLVRNGRRGARITPKGSAVARAAQVCRRVGFLSARIDEMTCRMDFDLARGRGKVVINLSLVEPDVLRAHLSEIGRVFADGYAMGTRVGLLPPGASLGEATVPPGRVGVCTVCSITLNGILLARGVPTRSRFGGLLALNEGRPDRFVELIEYDGTSIDPLEIFIRSGMTDYLGAIATGTGRVGASFREYPASSREVVLATAKELEARGLAGFVEIGYPGCALKGVGVSEGRFGGIVMGGLNPIAILEERNIRIDSRALHGLMPYEELFPYNELPARLDAAG